MPTTITFFGIYLPSTSPKGETTPEFRAGQLMGLCAIITAMLATVVSGCAGISLM
jgi:hypothetical protein